MSSGGFSLGKIKEVFDANKTAETAAAETVRVAIQLLPGAPVGQVQALKGAFFPFTSTGLVHVAAVTELEVTVNPDTDLCIVVCGTSPAAADAVGRAWLGAGVRTCLVAESAVELPEEPYDLVRIWGTVVAQDPDRMLAALADWCVGATDKAMALAASFPFCRAALAKKETFSCAVANAGVGAIDLVKGADFPVMFATEAGLVARIAAVYGYGSSKPNVPALIGVAAVGVATREAARRLCAWAPGVSWLIRGALGWVGTVAVGAAATARYEMGDQFDDAVAGAKERVTELAQDVTHRVALAAGQVVEVEPGAVYSQPEGATSVPPEAEDAPERAGGPQWFTVSGGQAAEAR